MVLRGQWLWVEVGRTGKTEIQTGVGGTKGRTGQTEIQTVVEVGMTGKTKVDTGVRVVGTEIGGSGTAGKGVGLIRQRFRQEWVVPRVGLVRLG